MSRISSGRTRKISAAALLAALLATHDARGGTIYWMTDDACRDFKSPAVSRYAGTNFPNCRIGTTNVSICPKTNFSPWNDPYNSYQQINITGYQISVKADSTDGDLNLIVGSSHRPDTTDVFATCAGHGSWGCSRTLAIPLPQGGSPAVDGSHIDVYAYCSGTAQYHIVVLLEYTP